ncbi:MAG: methylenetetrahydrofolate reductase [NAD(P)H] [Denitrovibrio sp.]|nr:MAG: methylenetetrahydrofolate reductase [NAD(P)H] [Denitrovibrio sp.]
MKISEILKSKRPVSFEFFPPKKQESEHVLFNTIKELRKYNPYFVSVTYGAGGSTADKTLEWTKCMKQDYDYSVMMHLTCVGVGIDTIDDIIAKLTELKVDNILALRGDMPAEMSEGNICRDFGFAGDLVKYIKLKAGEKFSIGVAGYPEKHPEAKSMADDIENLKRKIDEGADFVITQLFFDNFHYYHYMDKVRAAGIDVPVIAGIMPIINISQAVKFTQMCGASIPKPLLAKMENMSAEDQFKTGIEFASKQCGGLWASGVDGLHFYTLNKYGATEQILNNVF